VTRYLVDASAIIHLERVGEVGLLRELLGEIHITAEVAVELRGGPSSIGLDAPQFKGWVVLLAGRRPIPRLGLGKGESSMLLAARAGDRLVLDDAHARALAEARGLEYVGLLGLLLAGATTRRIERDRALRILDALMATEFRLAPGLYTRARQTLDAVK